MLHFFIVYSLSLCVYYLDRGFNKFRDGTLKCTIIFFESLFTMIDIDQRHKRVLQEMNDNLKINNSDDEYDI